MKLKFYLIWSTVIIWATFIFVMSGMNTDSSNTKSKSALNEIVEKAVETTNGIGITNKHPSKNSMKKFIEKYNYLFRKFAHASEYFILTILLLIALKNSGVDDKKIFAIAILVCFLYACSDEYHQTFVDGRTGQFSDTLIDTFGGLIGCVMYFLINKKFGSMSSSVGGPKNE